MKFYKTPENIVFAYESDGSQDCLIPESQTQITEAEANVLRNPPMNPEQVWERIKAERDRRKAAGVKVGAKWFHSDEASKIQQIGLVIMGASIPAGLMWKTMDGSFVTMTPAMASQVFAAVVAHEQAVFAAAETHNTAMRAAADPAAYDFSSGWPATYAEATP